MKIFISFPCSTLFLAFLITIQAVRSQNLIHSICQTSSKNDSNINYSFCKTSLQAAPASQCAALHGLGMISIRLVRYNVTDTRCYIKQLLKTKKWDPYVRQCLNDCFDLYSDAIPTVKLAMRYYNSKRFDDANIQISSIMEAATTCEDGFGEKEGVVSPLTKRNKDSFQLSAVVLSVMRIIQAGSLGCTNCSTRVYGRWIYY
ncbi:putative invertase inhibitor [Primulina eburnea]|uniref:putative invertase inhibitor n=1 Tax=Primulina eburnea TaxID=1245227 RepID=UPI003C6BF638